LLKVVKVAKAIDGVELKKHPFTRILVQTLLSYRNTFAGSMPQNVFNHQLLLLLPIDPMPERIKRLERNYPGIKVMWHNIKSSEGGRAEMTISTECWKRTTLLCTYTQLPTAEEAPNVRFVQLTSAGVEHCVGNSLYCDTNIPFCTSNGVHPPQIAEWVIGSWLSFQHRFSRYTKHMLEGYWEPPYKSEAEDSLGMRM
jgi:lactate dehydrogenase-like 2-hydroxyacid dehydrogenase